jgi:hypothetical protein
MGITEHFVLPFFFLRPFRCGGCNGRHYGFVFRSFDREAAAEVVVPEEMPDSVASTVRPAKMEKETEAAKDAKPKRIWFSEGRTVFVTDDANLIATSGTVSNDTLPERTAGIELSTCSFLGCHAPKHLE